MAGYRTQIKAFLLCLTLFLVSSCLPEDSTAVSNGEDQAVSAALSRAPQQIAQKEAATFMSAARNIAGQVTVSTGFSNGSLATGEISFAALGIQGIPSNIRAAYCEETHPDGSVIGQVISWIDNGNGTAFSVQGIEQNAGETIMNNILKQSDSVTAGMANGREVAWMNDDGSVDKTTTLSSCGGVNIPANTPVIMSENLLASSIAELDFGSVFQYTSEACPAGELGNITKRRSVMQVENQVAGSDPVEQFEYGDWEEFQNNCMEVLEQLDTGLVTIEVFANQAPGEMQGLEISEVLSSLNDTECMGVDDPDPAVDQQGNQIPSQRDCGFIRDHHRQDMENPYGSELEVTDEVVDTEVLTHACPVGDTAAIAGYVQGFSGLVDVTSGWQGTMEFARYYHNVMNMAGEQQQDTNTTFRNQWQGHTLLCTRDEVLNIECDTAYPQFSGPTFIPVDTQGYNFTRQNVIDGWQDPVNFVPNQSLPNDQGWQAGGGNCSWNETINFDNVPAGYTPTQPGGGIYQRLVTASDLNVTPAQGQWVGVTPSVGTRVTVNTLACPSGFTGSITETTTYRSTAEFPWSTPAITNTVATDNNCTCSAEIELRQTATTCTDGSAGTVNEERQRQCPSGNWGAWVQTGSTCAGAGGIASCGPSGEMEFSTPPASGLCDVGTAEGMHLYTYTNNVGQTSNTYRWYCRTAGGASEARCSANRNPSAPGGGSGDPAACGPASVMPFSSFPTTDLCDSGTAENRRNAVSPSGIPLFLWDCRQTDGTVASGCSSRNIATAPSGAGSMCGPASNGVFGTITAPNQFYAAAQLCASNATSSSQSTRNQGGFYIYEWSCQSPTSSAACAYMISESYFTGGTPATGSGPICGTAVNTCVNGVMQDSWDTDRYWWECRVGGGTGACDSDPNCEHCEAPFGASTANCAGQTLNANGCSYPFSGANHGTTQTVQTSTAGFVGQMNAQCSGGNWSAVTSSCTAAAPTNAGDCPAQTITWGTGCSLTLPSREDGYSGRGRSATSNGGMARFTCSSGTWVTSEEVCSTIEFGCGPAGEMEFPAPPTTQLCNASTASGMHRNDWGSYLWYCTASDGASIICSADSTARYDASCGSAHRSGSTSSPGWANRCNTGRPVDLTHESNGYYTWTCSGNNGGTDVNCTTAP